MQRHQALNLHEENPDYRMVVECAFEEYQDAFLKGYATEEDVQFVAVLAITMTLTAKHLFLKLGDGAPYLAAADLGRIYSISQSLRSHFCLCVYKRPSSDSVKQKGLQTHGVLPEHERFPCLPAYILGYG